MDQWDDYIPCYRKSDCEISAIHQLLAASNSANYPKEKGDPGNPNVTVTCGKQIREKENPAHNKEPEVKPVEEKKDEDDPDILTVASIFETLRLKDASDYDECDLCSWQLCPSTHAQTVRFGIRDVNRPKPQIRKFIPTHRSVNSATTKLTTRVPASPSKLKMSQSSRLDTQRPSSVTSSRPCSTSKTGKEELGAWQEPPPPVPIQYNFKYLKHPRQYSDQYREMYTYCKLKQRSFHRSFVTGVAVPRARLRCMNGREGRSKAIASGKHVPTSTPTTSDSDHEKSMAITWQLNEQLLKSCDVELSVNNPSPTEIAMLAKIPHIHRSSPSIPSNTNGKYGGKGTDKPYPFQLNISADAHTVKPPSVKKTGRPICIH